MLGGALSRVGEDKAAGVQWRRVGSAWVRSPPSVAWGVVHFVGGAALGAAPQVCYEKLLSILCDEVGVLVVATPYNVGTNHGRLARQVETSFEEALEECRADGVAPATNAPIFKLGHSLGAKLLVITACSATKDKKTEGKSLAQEGMKPRLGLLAYNNFAVQDSVDFAGELIAQIQGGARGTATASAVSQVFSFVQQLSSQQGVKIEFSPTPAELDATIADSYNAEDTSIIRFESDQLDSSDGLLDSLPAAASVSRELLPGGHTAPVCFGFDAAELDPRAVALLGGLSTISLGDEEQVAEIADAVADWILPDGMRRPKRQRVLTAGGAQGTAEAEVM